ncbi:uncharacterized protein BYT42DRAFT_609483 [Radiomyces spectabilis]|uniref:uncharacterized protein n=1 Tax=Radiomyces spectabilis TaxID=64574 RepID=UPI0022202A53|nr:uncharacterized protein BYT42DRAFT_609483 [Radiomyces spectabilis]KAI8393712.1 hypothetical protein BYT42DRAFT_609483 [Radiomyces spectabilis]
MPARANAWWLALFTLLMGSSSFAQWSRTLSLPNTYLGSTPYQGLSFTSPNITSALRIQRDIALNVTIDRIHWPAIHLASYFDRDYSAENIQTVENLLVMGYQRLVLDIYWDASRATWQLCPEVMPVTATDDDHDRNTNLRRVGRYNCSPSTSFRQFMEAVNNYLLMTDLSTDSANTHLIFLILNLHSLNGTSGAYALKPEKISSNDDSSLSNIIQSAIDRSVNNSPRYYTPRNLTDNRRNVNGSFYVDGMPYPLPSRTDHNDPSPAWPAWGYLVERNVQLLVGFGKNNLPNGSNYDISDDRDIIFDPEVLGAGSRMEKVTLKDMNATGWADCNRPGNTTVMIPADGNSTHWQPPSQQASVLSWSWSFMMDGQDRFTYDTALHATECGYSPYFTASNYSEKGSSYSVNDTGHFADNILSSIWSWEVGEPRTSGNLHCAMIQRWNGRWRAGDCTHLLRVACRHVNDANEWVLTPTFFSYDRALSACPEDYVFDTPRIAQQNRMLFNVLQKDLVHESVDDESESTDPTHHLFWINLNSATGDNCWVVGRNSTCWWLNHSGRPYLLLIKTSIVGGIIVLILFGFCAWVKCARVWRSRKSRGRKNMVKQLLAKREYVTVPA